MYTTKDVQMIRKIVIFIFSYLIAMNAFCEHELLGLVDATTGEGIPDARALFTTKTEITNVVRTEITNAVIENLSPILATNFMQINGGASVKTNSRLSGQTLIFDGIDTNGNFSYRHGWVQASATNVYSFFFKDNGTNVWRVTDGSTEKFDVRFSTNALPSNNIPVYSIGNYQNTIITGGVDTVDSQTNIVTYGMIFSIPPTANITIKDDQGQLICTYVSAYEDHLEYIVRNSYSIITNGFQVYWSVFGIPQ